MMEEKRMRGRQWILGIAAVLAVVAIGVVVAVMLRPPSEDPPALDLEAIQLEMDAGAFGSARAKLLAAIEADETNADAHFKLGLVSFNLGEYEQAHASFSRSMELDPQRTAAVFHNLGVLAYQLGDLETAVARFEAALATDPEDADTHYQLGAALLVQAFPAGVLEPDPALLERAEVEFRRALELVRDKPEALVGLANIAMLRNNMDEAVLILEQAVDLEPTMGEALFALGRAYAVVGRVSEAEVTLRRFLDTDPPAMWAQQAELILGELNIE
jgi:tetratricopeptide (TPR) repeat protein